MNLKKILPTFLVLTYSVAIAPGALPQAATQSAKPAASAKAALAVKSSAIQLNPEISLQHQRIQNHLPAQTKQKLARMVPDFDRQVRASKKGTDLRELATAEVRKQFPHLTPQQTNVLAFNLLKDAYDNSQNSLGDMSAMDQMQLQMAMDKKSQFESMLSNMLKSISDTSDSVIQNIK
jgi:hypothetical protein